MIDPEEIRRLVQRGREAGLVSGGKNDTPVSIEKNGETVAAGSGLNSQWFNVDPALATKWLENNFRNRPVKEDVVQAYARDMINGVWVPTHQGIAFNDRDELIDGQHRLLAIVMSGLTIRMMVTFGLPSEIPQKEMTTMDAVDRGRTRSVADQLKIQHGFKNGGVIASMCSNLAGLCYGKRTRRLSVGQTLEIYRAFESPINYIIRYRSKTVGLRSAGVMAAFAFALATESGYDEEVTPLAKMWDELTTGEDIDEASPLGLLRAFLMSDDAKLLSRGTDRGVAELTLQTILLQQRGARPTKLEMSLEGVEHFRGLQPDRVAPIAEIFQLPNR